MLFTQPGAAAIGVPSSQAMSAGLQPEVAGPESEAGELVTLPQALVMVTLYEPKLVDEALRTERVGVFAPTTKPPLACGQLERGEPLSRHWKKRG